MSKETTPKSSRKTKTPQSPAYTLSQNEHGKWVGTLPDGTVAIICSHPRIAEQYLKQLAKKVR